MTINAKINAYIVERGIKQAYLVKKLGISAAKVSSMLNGKRKMSAGEFLTICEIFDVDPKTFSA